jgi:hypothetical protein
VVSFLLRHNQKNRVKPARGLVRLNFSARASIVLPEVRIHSFLPVPQVLYLRRNDGASFRSSDGMIKKSRKNRRGIGAVS